MHERSPIFDENEFNRALDESLGVSLAGEDQPDVPPDSGDIVPGEDEVPDIM